MESSTADRDGPSGATRPEAAVLTVQKSGRYVRVGTEEYPLATPGGHWALWSRTPVLGFRKIGSGYVRNIAPDEQLECYRVEHRGTYRGIPVTVEPGGGASGGGEPDRGEPDRGASDGGALVRLGTGDSRAAEQGFERVGFERPELQLWLKFVAVDDRDLRFTTTRTPEPMPWAAPSDESRRVSAPRAVPRVPEGEPSEWGAFTLRLITALRGVTDRVFLIVSVEDDPLRYVQFAGGPDALSVEAPGIDVVVDADESVLRAAGWEPPGVAQPNWTTELSLPAYAIEYRELAERCVAALRDAYGLKSPDVLAHRAWRDPEQLPPGEERSPERLASLDRGEASLVFSGLGRALS